MAVPAAYLAVILIWTTTPLAIKWSGNEDFLFGVTSRMVIGVLLAMALVAALRLPMHWGKRARKTYLAAGLGIYGSMLSVYWAAQYIPSGWISVIFGLTPVMTGVLSVKLLANEKLGMLQLLAMLIGLAGLVTIFYTGEKMSDSVSYGVIGVLLSVALHSISSVSVKKIGYQAHGLVVATGGLMVAVPLFLLTWFTTGSEWPQELSDRTIKSILYLGIIGSVLGFALYYYILKKISPVRVAMLTLVTPVTALLLGNWLNNEPVSQSVIVGTVLIMSGLVLFELANRKRIRSLVRQIT